MSFFAELLYSRRVPHIAALALISFGLAGCSGDVSSRLSNPFGYQPEATGSVQPPAAVPPRELPQYARPQASYVAPAISPPQSIPAASGGVSGGGRGLASYAPPPQPKLDVPPAPPRLETTGTVPPRPIPAVHPATAPSSSGITIIVGTSDTLEILARRYNVAPGAILAANGYRGPRALSPGQQLIIPRPTAAVAAAPAMAPVVPVSKPVAVASAAPGVP